MGSSTEAELARLAHEARACRVCADHLPLGPRPTFRVSASARLLIAGQAPAAAQNLTRDLFNPVRGNFVAQRDRPLQPSQGLDTSALSLRRPSAPTADDNDSPPRAWNR